MYRNVKNVDTDIHIPSDCAVQTWLGITILPQPSPKETTNIGMDPICKEHLCNSSPLEKTIKNHVKDFDIPKSDEQCRARLREMFMQNKEVTDIRVIDMLVIKVQMELQESVKLWKQKGHITLFALTLIYGDDLKMLIVQMELQESVKLWKQKGHITLFALTLIYGDDLKMLIVQMELQESVKLWKQKGHIMAFFKPTEEPKPKGFLSKFFSGNE